MKYFRYAEFLCHCARPECDAVEMRPAFLDALERLRAEWGRPLFVTSGERCRWWNQAVGGSENSQHLLGNAVDVKMPKIDQHLFSLLAEKYGFTGIGQGQTFTHLDRRATKARWEYPPGH